MPLEKIIVAFEKEKNALYIRELLESAGLATAQICRSGMEVRRLVGRESCLCVICGYKLPDGSAEALFEDLPRETAMVMVATQPQLDLCAEVGIVKLPAPVRREELLSTVEPLLRLGHPMSEAPREEERLIRRAKALLMTRRGMSEAEAHRFLQKRSMTLGLGLPEVARLTLEERG